MQHCSHSYHHILSACRGLLCHTYPQSRAPLCCSPAARGLRQVRLRERPLTLRSTARLASTSMAPAVDGSVPLHTMCINPLATSSRTRCLEVQTPGQQSNYTDGFPPQSLASLEDAAALLKDGQTVGIPTETVYGLAADALSASAVAGIYAAKNRPADNPLIVHVSSLEMLTTLYPPGWQLPPAYAEAVKHFWPGPLTIILPKSPQVPATVTCGLDTMAVRIPAHPVARKLIHMCGFPLAAPSANSSGRPSPTLASHVLADLAGKIPLVLDGGRCSCGIESTVLDALRMPPIILRPGGVTLEQLQPLRGLEGLQVYSKGTADPGLEERPTTPGMKYQHYSPRAEVVLVSAPAAPAGSEAGAGAVHAALQERVAWEVEAQGRAGRRHVGVLVSQGSVGGEVPAGSLTKWAAGGAVDVLAYSLGEWGKGEQAQFELFAGLRALDELGVEVIVVEAVREGGEGLAIMNRLRKAASRVVDV